MDDGKTRGPTEVRDPTPLPKKCPSCTFVKPAKAVVCPACGFKAEAKNKVQCEDGELVEITAKIAKGKWLSPDEKRSIYGQLRHYGASKYHHKGWAKRRFVAFTGVWPDGVEDAKPVPPTPAMLSWIKSENIRYVNSLGYKNHRQRSAAPKQGASSRGD